MDEATAAELAALSDAARRWLRFLRLDTKTALCAAIQAPVHRTRLAPGPDAGGLSRIGPMGTQQARSAPVMGLGHQQFSRASQSSLSAKP